MNSKTKIKEKNHYLNKTDSEKKNKQVHLVMSIYIALEFDFYIINF